MYLAENTIGSGIQLQLKTSSLQHCCVNLVEGTPNLATLRLRATDERQTR